MRVCRTHVANNPLLLGMERTVRQRNQLPTNLPQLQNLIKRDGDLYKDEFLQQYHHYQSLLQLFLINPSQQSSRLEELIMFLSQVCCCYPDDMAGFPAELQSLLRKHAPILDPDVRLTLCRGLILMRNKSFIAPQSLLELFFELFRCQDKVLRMTLYNHIVADMKRMNAKHKNNKVNRGLQSFMYTMLADSSPIAARMSLDIMVEMYKKNIWNDAKTVNVVSTACFSPISRIVSTALKFFLSGDEGADDEGAESSGSEDESNVAMRKIIISKQVTKKGKKQRRKIEKALATIKKHQKRRKGPKQSCFSALHLLHDPQDFAEKLFKVLEKTREKFAIRMMMMSLISRLIGLHQLFVFNYYPYLQRFLLPHQKDVTRILTFLAQACHELVPPDILQPTLRAVVYNFVSERNSSEVIVVGLNTVREVCVRCPLVMDEDLLRDLTAYKSYKDKGVMMASRSLIQLFRNIQPGMLHRKDRGKPTQSQSAAVSKDYGEVRAAEIIPGTELVDLDSDQASNDDNEGESIQDDSDDSYGEWIDIHHASDDNDSDNGVHTLELESEDESDDWVEQESESESESEPHSPQYVEDREGGSVPFQDKDEPSTSTGRSAVKKVQFSGGEVEAPKEVLKEVKEQRLQRAADIAQSRILTQEEFRTIRQTQLSSKLAPRRGVKRQLTELLAQQEDRREGEGELLPEAAIMTLDHVKIKVAERIGTSLAPRGTSSILTAVPPTKTKTRRKHS
ncbi:protein SDA1 homolog isoform X2 [Halichondria panicea]|uniref:protein SDA1 homolog isoform X2 n=1 Tax=Halichondria panicea TaxID=6063 RepID=UPI00312B64AB